MSAMTMSSVDLQETPTSDAGCAGGPAGQYPGLMKLIVSALAALFLASSPLAAQTLEADMKKAAGAYENKDMTTAVRIWKVWADKGNAEARTLLGAMYWSGEGVPRDHKEAARLYLLAANQGYARAQNNIGFMLGFGEGIPPPDDVEAYKWLTLAINGYTARNQDRLEQARQDLATLAKRMNPAQISEAERRAKAFKPTP
jgi:TPR repeat protein